MRVILADDATLVREGVARLLTEHGFEVVAQLRDADGLVDAVGAHRPDVVVVDIRMPPTHTVEGLRAALEIRARYPDVGVLVLSQHVESRYAVDLLKSGGGVGTCSRSGWATSPASPTPSGGSAPVAPPWTQRWWSACSDGRRTTTPWNG